MSDDLEIKQRAFDILVVLLAGNKTVGISGLEVNAEAHLPSGAIHSTMATLERSELVESRWEGEPFPSEKLGSAQDERPIGRPRRRFYRITSSGRKAAAAWRLERHRKGGPNWVALPKLV